MELKDYTTEELKAELKRRAAEEKAKKASVLRCRMCKHWGMGVYMDEIPQNEQNTSRLVSVPLKIYDKSEYLDIPVPRKGEEIFGVYDNGKNRFEMTGIVTRVFYNIDMDWIVVHCKCTEIIRRDKNA